MSVKELVGGSFDPQCKEIRDSDSLKKELLITFFPLYEFNLAKALIAAIWEIEFDVVENLLGPIGNRAQLAGSKG